MVLQVERRLFTVAEYDQMIQAGIFAEDDHLELIEGEIVSMSPISILHAACVKRLVRIFVSSLAETEAIVGVQDPIKLGEMSEPEPDLTLLQPRRDYYSQSHPQAKDVLLLIEVSETSLRYDKEQKLPLYAQSGINEVWIVNLKEQIIEQYRSPSQSAYQLRTTFDLDQLITPSAFPELSIPVTKILSLS